MHKFDASVVIPAYNEETKIAQCLESLVLQKTRYSFEVIVVDNASTDGTHKIAVSFKTRLSLKIIYVKQKGRGMARAQGFDAAASEIVLSTDADSIVPAQWVEHMVSFLKSSSHVAVTGYGYVIDMHWLKNAVLTFVGQVYVYLYRFAFQHFLLLGFTFGIKKAAYTRAGGFDRSLNTNEDTELSIRVHKIGSIGFSKNVSVIVSGRRWQQGIIKSFVEYMRIFVQYFVLKKQASKVILSDVR